MKFSICITTLNDARTLRSSLSSIFREIDSKETQVVVVDSESRDGSTEILKDYEAKGMLRLVIERCSVGRGRQLAFLHSSGEYIVAYLDTDDLYRGLGDVLGEYTRQYQGKVLKGADFLIVPRRAVELVGGWRDLHTAEDLDFQIRIQRSVGLIQVPWAVKVDFQARRFRMPFRAIEAVRKMWDMIGLGMPPDKYVLNRKWELVFLALLALHRIIPQGGPKRNPLTDYLLSLAR